MQVAHLEKSNHYLTATREQRRQPAYQTCSRCFGARSETTRLWLCILPRASRTSRNGSRPCCCRASCENSCACRCGGPGALPRVRADVEKLHPNCDPGRASSRTVGCAAAALMCDSEGQQLVVYGGAGVFSEEPLRCHGVCSGERRMALRDCAELLRCQDSMMSQQTCQDLQQNLPTAAGTSRSPRHETSWSGCRLQPVFDGQ